ncbi:MAG: AtpZ/AtpI family protein [Cyclonatronaceae bacterium]
MQIRDLAAYGEYIALGTHIAASMIIPVVIGIYVDKRWETSPWGVIIGALMGFASMISIVIKLAAKTGKNQYMEKKKTESGDGNDKI